METRLIENIVECKDREHPGTYRRSGRLIENIVECKDKEHCPVRPPAKEINRKHSGM